MSIFISKWTVTPCRSNNYNTPSWGFLPVCLSHLNLFHYPNTSKQLTLTHILVKCFDVISICRPYHTGELYIYLRCEFSFPTSDFSLLAPYSLNFSTAAMFIWSFQICNFVSRNFDIKDFIWNTRKSLHCSRLYSFLKYSCSSNEILSSNTASWLSIKLSLQEKRVL